VLVGADLDHDRTPDPKVELLATRGISIDASRCGTVVRDST
jgi:hypothetical protein